MLSKCSLNGDSQRAVYGPASLLYRRQAQQGDGAFDGLSHVEFSKQYQCLLTQLIIEWE